jgi:hypothetical protein
MIPKDCGLSDHQLGKRGASERRSFQFNRKRQRS